MTGLRGWGSRARLRTGVASSRVRFEQRAAAVRSRPKRIIAWGVALLVLMGLVGWVFWMSPVFTVDEVRVEGGPSDGATSVLSAAGITLGTPLARVDTAGASSRVRDGVPWVKEVEVSRRWPRDVLITVIPRSPVLGVRGSDGTFTLIDHAGVSFETASALPAGVVLVTPSTSAPAPEGLRAVLGVLAALPPDQRAAVTNVTIASASSVSFSLGEVQVVWGGPTDVDKKLRVLAILLPTHPSVIDVSTPDTPVTR